MKISGVAPHEHVTPRYRGGTECVVSVTLRWLFQHAAERRVTGTRTAREYVQQRDHLIAENQDLAEAS
jgi:hypothetical protein